MLADYGDPDRAKELYARYLQQGAHVAWATHFGRDCPEPDFAGAKHLQWVEPVWAARHFAGRHRWALAAALLVLVGGAGVLLRRRNRQG